MPAPSLSRLAILWLVLLPLITVNGTKLPSASAAGEETDLIVHEWGTFTSVVGREGYALEWRPLSFESDLPSFIYSIDKGASWLGFRYPSKSSISVLVRMETPILYFYAREETDVSVRVVFPGGKITEWYPQARAEGRSINWWQFKVMPGARVALPNDGRENHYYPARDTDAAPVQVKGADEKIEHEKFLFYRGVGNFALPLFARLQGDKVLVENVEGGGVGKVVLFESRGGRRGYIVRDLPKGEVTLDRPTLQDTTQNPRQDMKAMLISHGLYEKEADAMLNTWRDSWFEEGLRVFYIMPRKVTDTVLPVTIAPQPSELVRVLVGRVEMITPEMENNVTEQIKKLDDPSTSVRENALKEIKKYGRFVEPILQQVREHVIEPQIKIRVQQLLQEMSKQTARPG